MMTFKEMNLRIFQRQPVPHVFYQPRFEPWYDWNRQFNSLPPELQGMSLREVYDDIGASMRTVHYYTGQPNPVVSQFDDKINITQKEEGRHLIRRYDTPRGPLFDKLTLTVDNVYRTVQYPGKSPDDLAALRSLIEHQEISFSEENFAKGADYIGDRGFPSFWVPKSPYFALAQQWMDYPAFIYSLADRRSEVEDLMKVIDESYDRLYDQLTSFGGTRVLNFGENIAMAYLSLEYFEQYCIPWYEKRAGQLREAGIFTHIHIDGHFKPLLPYLKDLPFDGLEALTPEPQGDVTLQQMRDSMGDKILLDGIPAIYFLAHHPPEELYACVETIIDYFHPRLILGISDELPEGGGEESFKRLKWVADYCRNST